MEEIGALSFWIFDEQLQLPVRLPSLLSLYLYLYFHLYLYLYIHLYLYLFLVILSGYFLVWNFDEQLQLPVRLPSLLSLYLYLYFYLFLYLFIYISVFVSAMAPDLVFLSVYFLVWHFYDQLLLPVWLPSLLTLYFHLYLYLYIFIPGSVVVIASVLVFLSVYLLAWHFMISCNCRYTVANSFHCCAKFSLKITSCNCKHGYGLVWFFTTVLPLFIVTNIFHSSVFFVVVAVVGITGCRWRKYKYKYKHIHMNTNTITNRDTNTIIWLEFMGIMTKAVGGITGCRRFLPRTELCMADTASCTDTGAWWWWWWGWWWWGGGRQWPMLSNINIMARILHSRII